MRRVYTRRREALLDALARGFGPRVRVIGEPAGLHLVVRFDGPEPGDRAKRRGVLLVSSAPCYGSAPPANEYIVRFHGVSERVLVEAVRRLTAR